MADKKRFLSAPITWGKTPLLFPLLAFLSGLLAATQLDFPTAPYALFVVGACVALAVGFYLIRARFLVPKTWLVALTLVALFFGGLWRAGISHPPNQVNFFAKQLAENAVLGVEVIRIRPGEKSFRLETQAEYVYKDSADSPATGQLLIYLPPDIKTASVKVGDKIVVRGRLDTLRGPLNPGAFDSRAYWASQGIYHRIYVSDARVWRHIRSKGWGLRAKAERVRRAWFKSFEPYLTGDELAVASALIMGKKDLLTAEVRSAYSDTGAMHVLAVSGLHVGIILLIFRTLFSVFPKRNSVVGRIAETLITLLAIWGFAYVSGLSPSVRRAAIMFSIIVAGRLVLRQSYLLNTLTGAALVMLWFEPGQVLQIGFQLSFLALIGIIWFATPLQRLLPGEAWPWSAIKGGVAASIGAQLGTIPVALFTFRTFPLYFMLSGSAVVIFAYLAMCAGLIHGAIYACFGFGRVTDITGWLLAQVVTLQNAFIYACAQLPGGVLELRSFSVWSAVLSALAIMSLAYFINYRDRWSGYLFLALSAVTIYSALPRVPGEGASGTVTVYHLSRKSLIEWTDQSGGIALGDDLEPEEITFNVAPNRKQLGYDIDVVNPIDTVSSFVVGDQAWAVLEKDQKTIPVLGSTRYVLIRNGLKPTQLADLDLSETPTLIVDGSNPPWLYDEWKAFGDSAGVEVWITGRRGAFVIDY